MMIVMCRYPCLMPLRRHRLLDLLTRLLIDAAELCARRMSSLKFHNHINCVKCSVKDCSVDITYSKNVKWLVQFILGCVYCQHTLVKKVRVIIHSPLFDNTNSQGCHELRILVSFYLPSGTENISPVVM